MTYSAPPYLYPASVGGRNIVDRMSVAFIENQHPMIFVLKNLRVAGVTTIPCFLTVDHRVVLVFCESTPIVKAIRNPLHLSSGSRYSYISPFEARHIFKHPIIRLHRRKAGIDLKTCFYLELRDLTIIFAR